MPTEATLFPRRTGPLPQRIARLRAELAAAREKEQRLRASINLRQSALNRLEACIALGGDVGEARNTCD